MRRWRRAVEERTHLGSGLLGDIVERAERARRKQRLTRRPEGPYGGLTPHLCLRKKALDQASLADAGLAAHEGDSTLPRVLSSSSALRAASSRSRSSRSPAATLFPLPAGGCRCVAKSTPQCTAFERCSPAALRIRANDDIMTHREAARWCCLSTLPALPVIATSQGTTAPARHPAFKQNAPYAQCNERIDREVAVSDRWELRWRHPACGVT